MAGGSSFNVGGGTGVAKNKNAPPHLIMEHCTVESTGLVDLTNTPPSSVLNVEVNYCAIKAESTSGLRRGSSLPLNSTGKGWAINTTLWDVSGSCFPPGRELQQSQACTDLQSWLQFASGDRNPIPDKLKFMTEPMARKTPGQPNDFKIQAPVGSKTRPGGRPLSGRPMEQPMSCLDACTIT